jgi:hypothetical protein
MRRLLGLIGLFALAAGLLWLGTLAAEEQPNQPRLTSAQPPAPGAQPAHSLEKSQLHGGRATMTKAHHFETALSRDGVRIYRYTAGQAPAEIDQATGTATLGFKDGTKKELPLVKKVPVEGESAVYFCPMHEQVVQTEPGVCEACGGMKLILQDYLYGEADLSHVDPVAMSAMLRIDGLAGEEPSVTFALAPPSAALSAAPTKSSREAVPEGDGH